MTVWQRNKAKISRLFRGTGTPSKMRTAYEWTFRLPPEIVEMIFAYFARNLAALKACSLICRSWYMVAAPSLHHTLRLRNEGHRAGFDRLERLSKLHKLGLTPL
jgi:hypothetical protein